MPTGHTRSIGGNQVNSTVVFHRSTLSSCLVVPELLNLMRNALSLKLTSEQLWILLKVFSQTTETTLFPDLDGFIYQRTQDRPYVPEDYESYRAAGYRASQRGDNEEAISYFDEAILLNSTEADIYYLRGESKYYLRQFVEAIPDFDKAIELKDDDINYYRSPWICTTSS